MGEADEQPELSDELLEVRRRRYQEARDAGLSIVEAKLVSESDADMGLLRRLVKDRCDPRLIFEILW